MNVIIEDLSVEGDGVARHEGVVCQVANEYPRTITIGDEVNVEVVSRRSSYCRADVKEIVKSSPLRVEPPCALNGRCGGCSLLELRYDEQLRWKKAYLETTLKNVAGADIKAEEILGSEQTLNYRNKAQFPIGLKDGKPVAGFFRRRSHAFLEVASCPTTEPPHAEVIKAFNECAAANNMTVYDETTGKGLLRHLIVKTAQGGKESMVCVVINGDHFPKAKDFILRLREIGVGSLVVNTNTEQTNVILGERFVKLYGDGYVTEKMCGLNLRVSAPSFFQVNVPQAEKMYNRAVEYLAPKRGETIADAYCGTGSITLAIAKAIGGKANVIGIESNPSAIRDAKANAAANHLWARFMVGAAEKLLQRIPATNGVVVDPPRKGLHPEMIKTLLRKPPERIVYVSCNPATLSRDIFGLKEMFEVVKTTAVDMFPMTTQVESVTLLARKK